MMTVFHKRSQIALLRSMGMSQKEIIKLFLSHGFAIGLIGSITGILFGILTCVTVKYYLPLEITLMPNWNIYIPKYPIKFLPFEYLVIAVSALSLSVLSAIYPASIAAVQDPGQGLKYSNNNFIRRFMSIKLEQVDKVFKIEKQTIHALRNVNLEVKKGACVSITGRSGAGKSTLLHLIGMLDKVSSAVFT